MTTVEICCVCSEVLTALRRADCSTCYQPFHLNTRMDQMEAECGDVWISDASQGLEFGCRVCIEAATPQGALDDVLDLTEAAEAAGMAPAELALAAELGQVRHRKTSGGMYLFERRDILAFVEGGGRGA